MFVDGRGGRVRCGVSCDVSAVEYLFVLQRFYRRGERELVTRDRSRCFAGRVFLPEPALRSRSWRSLWRNGEVGSRMSHLCVSGGHH